MKALLALLAAALPASAQPAASQASAPPRYSLDVGNEVVQGAWRPRLLDTKEDSLIWSVRGGALAVTDAYTQYLPILDPSMFAVTSMRYVHDGTVKFMGVVTGGGVSLNSRRAAGGADIASPAASLQASDRITQNWGVGSYYFDLGKTVSAGSGVKGAFFLATQGFGVYVPGGDMLNHRMLTDSSAGTVWVAKAGRNEFAAHAAATVEPAPGNAYRNDGSIDWAPSAQGGVEAGYRLAKRTKIAAGVEVKDSRELLRFQPYGRFSASGIDVTVAGRQDHSKDAFIADSRGVAADVETQLGRFARVGINAAYADRQFPGTHQPMQDVRVGVGVTVHLDGDAAVKSEAAWRRSIASRARAADTVALNNRLPASGYSTTFRSAVQNSASFDSFVTNIGARSSDDILAAVSAWSAHFGAKNYNFNEGNPPNLDDVDALYARARQSYLTGKKDPILVCLGSAQFTAYLANRLGKEAGIPIEARSASVMVPDDAGRQSGHKVALIRTPDHGIVVADWGWLTLTGTNDPDAALNYYHAQHGYVALWNQLNEGTAEGRHLSYRWTPEGKMLVRVLGWRNDEPGVALERMHDDPPAGAGFPVQRYRRELEDQLGIN